jgi:hypothetical protein
MGQTFKLKNGGEVFISQLIHPSWADSTQCDWCGKTIKPGKPYFSGEGTCCSLAHAKAHAEFNVKKESNEQEDSNIENPENSNKDINWGDMLKEMKQKASDDAKDKIKKEFSDKFSIFKNWKPKK